MTKHLGIGTRVQIIDSRKTGVIVRLFSEGWFFVQHDRTGISTQYHSDELEVLPKEKQVEQKEY